MIAIAEDAPMVPCRMKLERGLVEVGRVEPAVGSATILQDAVKSTSLYRPGSMDSETCNYEPGDAPIMNRANSRDSIRTLNAGSVIGPPGNHDMPQ